MSQLLMSRHLLSSGLALALCLLCGSESNAQNIGADMVEFLQANVDKRVGGGESAHLATEALRVAGGEFVPSDLGADYPAAGDDVWGTFVTKISYANEQWTDSNPTDACQPGDVIQYGAATIGTTTFPAYHTSVVVAVNANGRPTSVYQQNFGGERTVQMAAIDTTALTAGWLRIYRPKARIDRFNEWKVTVVNNASNSRTYTVVVGTSTVRSVTLTAVNTSGSFRIHRISTIGTVPNVVLSTGESVFLETAKGNEIYNPTSGTGDLRQLSE